MQKRIKSAKFENFNFFIILFLYVDTVLELKNKCSDISVIFLPLLKKLIPAFLVYLKVLKTISFFYHFSNH